MNDERLQALARQLSAIRFSPRASLGPEQLGRAKRTPTAARGRFPWLRATLGLGAVALMVGLGGFFLLSSHSRRLPAHLSRTVDRCCQDLDGGGVADDGLVVLTDGGQRVRRLSIYEDRDHSGSYSSADALRFFRVGAPEVLRPVGPGTRTIEFCCVDYDGGGADDDALLVIGRPPDQIAMAAIYEYRSGAPKQHPLR